MSTAQTTITPTNFDRLLMPQTVAVVGASSKGNTPGNDLIRNLRKFGFKGEIYPVHPTTEQIEGLPAFKTIGDIGGPVDYAFVVVSAEQVPAVLLAAQGNLAFAQVMSSGFGEIEAGRTLQDELVRVSRADGIRVLGPNCLGTYSPAAGLSFVGSALGQAGSVSIVSQSGGTAVDIVLRGENKGVRYRAVVTLGNSADVTSAELLNYFLTDEQTEVIGLYIESSKEGREFFTSLRKARKQKPVVLLIGGLTEQGSRAATSHTGSLSGGRKLWEALARQTGVVLASTLDEFIDQLVTIQTLPLRARRSMGNVVLFGNGGGASVLAADAFARTDLRISPLAEHTLRSLDALKLPAGTSLVNPIDTPAEAMRQQGGKISGKILQIVFEDRAADAVVMHVNLPVFLSAPDHGVSMVSNLLDAVIASKQTYGKETPLLLVLRSDGSREADERRREGRALALAAGIPVLDELPAAAVALAAVRDYQRFLGKASDQRIEDKA
jgi:acyl-CoA synthetase (NDP forming)